MVRLMEGNVLGHDSSAKLELHVYLLSQILTFESSELREIPSHPGTP